MQKLKEFKINEMPVIIWLVATAIIFIALAIGAIPSDMTGALALCFGIGGVIVFVGDRIPIWKTFFGGGLLLTLLLGGVSKYMGWLPESAVSTISSFLGAQGFLNLFIIVLITGSILSVDRTMLLRSVSRFIPCILAACLGAAILACAVGLIFGNDISSTLSLYVLPIMSGGTTGKLALADMYAAAGMDYTFFMSVSTFAVVLGDILSCFTATILGRFFQGNKKICGDGSLLRTGDDPALQEAEQEELPPPTMKDLAGCLLILFSIWMLALIFGTKLLPTIFGVSIHQFAYAVIIAVVLNVTQVLPQNIVSALIYMQKYFMSAMVVVIMFCCGVAYLDVGTIIECITTPSIVLIVVGVVVGAVIGGGLMGQLVGFYPYEAAVTSGLCMSNAGGAGDVAVLSSCHRMNLMPYAQISSRIGNAIILLIGSVIFSILY